MGAALEVQDVDKRFGPVFAVRRARAVFEAGRIHAVIGENGAGKSTLLRVAAGLLPPDGGEVRVEGTRLSPHTPAEAIARGIAMVQQHFALVDELTALENIVLGAEPARGPFGALDLEGARRTVREASGELGAALPLEATVSQLGVADRQRTEIARALYRRARVLILDEPTAVLTPGEASALYATLRRLADAGRAVIVVTHKLDEVRDHADVATVMRRGEIIQSRAVARTEADLQSLAAAMVGANPPIPLQRQPRSIGEVVLRVEGLVVGRALRGVSIRVRAGEIVGVAGVEGNGQRELVAALAGLEEIDGGSVGPSADALAVVHEDRHKEGLVLEASIRENLLLGELGRFARCGVLDRAAIDREARARLPRGEGIRDLDTPTMALSGGNQQKIVVARSIARIAAGRARALVVAHPTRGVDLAASRAIHADIVAAAERGAAVLVVSSDLQELRALSDRLVVLARGKISAELARDASDDAIGTAMLGGEGASQRVDSEGATA